MSRHPSVIARRAADLEEVRKHVALLFDVHHTLRTISGISGVPYETLRHVLYRNRGVLPKTRDAILGIEVKPPWDFPGFALSDKDRTSATGTVRRIRALVRLGYPISEIAQETDGCAMRLRELAKSPHGLVRVQTARRIAEFYRRATRNEIRQGSQADRARRWAEEQGWPGVGAWDDIDRQEHPDEPGNMVTLIEYVKDEPGLTTSDLQRKIRADLGVPVKTFYELINEALDTGTLVRIRNHRYVRVYATG